MRDLIKWRLKLCYRLKHVFYSATAILHESDHVDEMLFINRGEVLNATINYGMRTRTKTRLDNLMTKVVKVVWSGPTHAQHVIFKIRLDRS